MKLSGGLILLVLITSTRCEFKDAEDEVCTGKEEECITSKIVNVMTDNNVIWPEIIDETKCLKVKQLCTQYRQSGIDYVFPEWDGDTFYRPSKTPNAIKIPNPCFWIPHYCHGMSVASYLTIAEPRDPFDI